MAAPIESKAGTEANHLLIQTVHACFSWNLTLRDRESRQLLNYFCRSLVCFVFFFFLVVAEWKGLFLSTYPAARAQANSLHQYGAYCHPPGSADAGFPRRRRREIYPVASLYSVSFLCLRVGLDGHVWRAAAHRSIQAGTHRHAVNSFMFMRSSTSPPGHFEFLPTEMGRWRVGSYREVSFLCVWVCVCAGV